MSDWFVVNVRDAPWRRHDAFGASCRFEDREQPFEQLGVNVRVLQPGQPNCLYHSENLQEDFLVLAGECVLLVDGEERPLRAWDFVHCPPGVEHVFVGAGDGPCVILMAGARSGDGPPLYPGSELAARYGASAPAQTPDPAGAPFPLSPPPPPPAPEPGGAPGRGGAPGGARGGGRPWGGGGRFSGPRRERAGRGRGRPPLPQRRRPGRAGCPRGRRRRLQAASRRWPSRPGCSSAAG